MFQSSESKPLGAFLFFKSCPNALPSPGPKHRREVCKKSYEEQQNNKTILIKGHITGGTFFTGRGYNVM